MSNMFTRRRSLVQNGKIEPLDIVECRKCSQLYEPADFIYTLIELHSNISISSNSSNENVYSSS